MAVAGPRIHVVCCIIMRMSQASQVIRLEQPLSIDEAIDQLPQDVDLDQVSRPAARGRSTLATSALIVAAAFVLSRVLGLAREIILADGAKDVLDAWRLRDRQAAGPDGFRDLGQRGLADLGPGGQALAQAGVGNVAIAVVGVLGEHGEHQLVDGGAVGLRHGPPVLDAKALEDRA